MSNQPSDYKIDAAVSYSRANEDRVEQILDALKARGVKVWFDKDIPGGALWEETIAQNYRACGALLFFVSKSSLDSKRCFEEVSTARTLGKPIIPVVLEPLKLPDDLPDRFVLTLQARNTVEVSTLTPERAEAAIVRALEAFGVAQGLPPRPASAAASPSPSQPTPRPAPKPAPEQLRTAPTAAPVAHEAPPRKSAFGPVVAFGGAALAIALVLGAWLVFGRGGPAEPAAPQLAAPPPAGSIVLTEPPAPTPAAPAGQPSPQPETGPVTPPAPPPSAPGAVVAGQPRITPFQASWPVGAPILLRIEGMPGDQRDYVAVAPAGAAPDERVSYVYTEGAKDKELKLKPLMKPGQYELRAFFGGEGNEEKIQATATIQIVEAPPVSIALENPAPVEGHPLVVAFDGMPGNDRDWISIADPTAGEGEYIAYEYTRGVRKGVVKLPAPVKPGRYEIRAYFDDSTGDRTVRARQVFEVAPAPEVQMTADAQVYAPEAPIKVAFSSMPGNDRDWISIAVAGTEDGAYKTYVYLRGQTSGAAELKAPAEPGAYELRAYFDDTTGDKTVRARVAFEVKAP